MADEEDFEQTLLVIKECFVYKIPPRSSNQGYRADVWLQNDPIWTGRLKVTAKGDLCTIVLEEANGDIFAICPVSNEGGQAVEPVTDSSRYFALRISDGRGNFAFIGIGFAQRTEAFDFNVALQDHKKFMAAVKAAQSAPADTGPKKDYSLKEGESISVTIKGKEGGRKKREVDLSALGGGAPLGNGLLPPPPKGQVVVASHNTGPSVATTASGAPLLNFGAIHNSPAKTTAAPTANPTVTVRSTTNGFADNADWSDFSGFGSGSASGGASSGSTTTGDAGAFGNTEWTAFE